MLNQILASDNIAQIYTPSDLRTFLAKSTAFLTKVSALPVDQIQSSALDPHVEVREEALLSNPAPALKAALEEGLALLRSLRAQVSGTQSNPDVDDVLETDPCLGDEETFFFLEPGDVVEATDAYSPVVEKSDVSDETPEFDMDDDNAEEASEETAETDQEVELVETAELESEIEVDLPEDEEILVADAPENTETDIKDFEGTDLSEESDAEDDYESDEDYEEEEEEDYEDDSEEELEDEDELEESEEDDLVDESDDADDLSEDDANSVTKNADEDQTNDIPEENEGIAATADSNEVEEASNETVVLEVNEETVVTADSNKAEETSNETVLEVNAAPELIEETADCQEIVSVDQKERAPLTMFFYIPRTRPEVMDEKEHVNVLSANSSSTLPLLRS